MAQLLLELFSEEIPAGLQIKAVDEFKVKMFERLKADSLPYDSVECYATPRRVVIVVEGLPKTQEDSVIERRGPRVDAPEKAVGGFLKSTGLSLDDLEKRKTDKGEFYFAVIKKEGRAVAEVLVESLQEMICSFTWAKSMKWGEHAVRWVRPLHSILCIFDGEKLPISFGHITASNSTKGHRFLSSGAFEVANFADYKKKLEDNFVILDIEKRKKIIENDSHNIAHSCGLSVKHDEKLLSEVAGLVEWPVTLLGHIEEKFLSVPKEALITSMRSHQKYFSLIDGAGDLAPYFIVISNIKTEDKGAKITAGNERVLSARLEDAKFFWDQDRRTSLESRGEKLKKVIFHAKLGTVAEKTDRISELAKLISVWIPRANLVLVERAAKLCKADLATEMVGEFPELQGLMGSYYALESKENEAVAQAIKDHYSPIGPNDSCPDAPLSIAVALADKVDSLVGLFAINEKPTGSKDPYALRRAALGVIRIILENNLRIPLRLLFEKSISKYPKSLLKSEKKGLKILPVVGDKSENAKSKQARIIDELLNFFADRLKVTLKEKNVRHDLIQAVFDGGNEDDFSRLITRVNALQEFLSTENGVNLVAAYKRATNIVLAEEKKTRTKYDGSPERSLLEATEERQLFGLFSEVKSSIDKNLKNEQFTNVMAELAKFRKPVDDFFENVTVNCDKDNVRKNRLLLLSQLRFSLNKVANFSKIES